MYNCPPPAPQEDSWEDMLDSGQLDQRLAKMDFSQPPPPIPGAYPQQQQYHQQLPRAVMPRMNVPPPNIRIMSRPGPARPGMMRPSCSGPPFAGRPSAAPAAGPLTDASPGHSPFPGVAPATALQQHQISESGGTHTPYKPSEPKLKILRRPGKSADGESNGGAASEPSKPQPKSLKQREEEYAQARLRILGSAGSDHEEDETEQQEQQAVVKVAEASTKGVASPPVAPVVRAPKGPDGTAGFHKK